MRGVAYLALRAQPPIPGRIDRRSWKGEATIYHSELTLISSSITLITTGLINHSPI